MLLSFSYSTRLPSDILSGCHSKFFSNSLDPTLAQPSMNVSNAGSTNSSHYLTHASPFHHPTPDLKQLARSVHLANLQAEKNAIPQSPTLVKLLAAKEEFNPTKYYFKDNQDEGDLGNGKDDVNWLMPATVPASLDEGGKTLFNHNKIILSKRSLSRTISSSNNSNINNNNLNHHTRRIVEFGKVKEIKVKREEIQKNMRNQNGFKPFNSSSSLVNAHLQSQSGKQTSDGDIGSRGSVMASSLGARNIKAAGGAVAGSLSGTVITDANGKTGDEPFRMDTSTIVNNAMTNNNGRISKRKAASPKKTTLPLDRGGSNNHSKGRTLVLATPVKSRTKSSSSSTSSLFDNNHRNGMALKQHDNIRNKTGLSKSKSLPAFKWGLPEFGKGIDEGDEEDMDRGLHDGSESDEDGDERERPMPSRGLLLVGETPQKG